MKYIFVPMNEKFANDIANWHYDDVYSFYDMAADQDDLKIFMDAENDEFWLSLGLRPDLTGQGLGEEFVSACVRHAISQYKLTKHVIKLDVALFNQRAIRVYQKVGFIEAKKTVKNTPIGQVDFIEMEKHIPHQLLRV